LGTAVIDEAQLDDLIGAGGNPGQLTLPLSA
jgi:hypothetical protein